MGFFSKSTQFAPGFITVGRKNRRFIYEECLALPHSVYLQPKILHLRTTSFMEYTENYWPSWQKVPYRYAVVFFGLILLSAIGGIIGLDALVWEPLVKFMADHVFEVGPISNTPTGSGDKLYDWCWYGTILIITGISGTIFNLLDHKRSNYLKLHAWLAFLLSFYLAFMLLSYGIIKLYGSQFTEPNLLRLHETYGHSSPMRLMWTFMGASKGYTVFAGVCETIPGILLLFRRTRTLGALVSFAVMVNVFALNVFYDVPVKLFSFQLVLISGFLVLPELGRLIKFFLLNESTPPSQQKPFSSNKKVYWGIKAVQLLLICAFVVSMHGSIQQGEQTYGRSRVKPPLYGIYEVTSFVRNGDTIPALTSLPERWQKMIIDYPDYTNLIYTNGKRKTISSSIDTTAQTITIQDQSFSYQTSGDVMSLEGMYGSDTLKIKLQPYDLGRFGLLNRGFNWVNEQPYNRYDPE